MSEISHHIEPGTHEEQSRYLPLGAEVVRFAELEIQEMVDAPPEVQRERHLSVDASELHTVESRVAALGRVRHVLDDIVDRWPEARARLDQSMNAAKDMPQLFKDWRGQEATDWAEWLTNQASDDQLLNILQWHNDRLRRYNNDPEIRAEVEARKSRFMEGVKSLFAQGYLCQDRYETTMNRLRSMEIHASDLYATDPTAFPEEQREEAIYYKSSRGVNKGSKYSQIYVLPELLIDESGKTVEHELAHEVETTFWTDPFWVGEVAADIIAVMVRKGSTRPEEIFRTLLEDESNPYSELEKYIVEYLRNPRVLKAFLRCASASTYKERAREQKILDEEAEMEEFLYRLDQEIRDHLIKTDSE